MTSPEPRAVLTLQFSRAAFAGLIAAWLAPWAVVAVYWACTHPHLWRFKSPTKNSASFPRVFTCKPGPWGEVECTRIIIEPPEEFISVAAHTTAQVKWTFRGYSKEQLAGLFESAGLDESRRKSLLGKAKKDSAVNGFVIVPDKELIWGMTPAQRAAIYSALSLFAENRFQCEPYRFRADTEDEWFEDSDLPAKTVAMTRKLLYRRGTSLLFSDIEHVLPLLQDSWERLRLLKTLGRKSTLLMKLRISRDADIPSLIRYWGKGGRSKDLEPLLESVATSRDVSSIDIVHLLPAFARMRLYTFPLPGPDPVVLRQDCYWTSLNFFNRDVDDRFTNPEHVYKTLISDYYQVASEPTFGDLIVFAKPNGEAVHAAVYVADNILFTKNGTLYQPWILMTLQDMIAFYPVEQSLQVQIYRHKSL